MLCKRCLSSHALSVRLSVRVSVTFVHSVKTNKHHSQRISALAHAKINRKIENSTFCKIITHENFNLKLGTHDYVVDITHHATFGSNRSSGGFPPNRGNITLLWLFCCSLFFLGHASRSNRRTDTYAEWLKRRDSAQGRSFWGSRQWVTSHGENMPGSKISIWRTFVFQKRK